MSRRRLVHADAATLAVPCPTCRVERGAKCRTVPVGTVGGPGRTREPHASRELLLRRQRSELVRLQKAAQLDAFAVVFPCYCCGRKGVGLNEHAEFACAEHGGRP